MSEQVNHTLESRPELTVSTSSDSAASSAPRPMRTLLICHEGARLDQEGLARWLASFSELAGVVVLRETRKQVWRRARRQAKRVGVARFLDVLALRVYYQLLLARRDSAWEEATLAELRRRYPQPDGVPVLITNSANSSEAERFIRQCAPDLVLARCKTILKESVFSIPTNGTFVMHPGICPEYRNSHGCFWALANGETDKVGMTLLRIDKGVDTGPIYGYYSYDYDEVNESHYVIQQRVVTDNLDQLAEQLRVIYAGRAVPINVAGRESAAWGMPWLTSYLKWKRRARRAK